MLCPRIYHQERARDNGERIMNIEYRITNSKEKGKEKEKENIEGSL